MSYEIKRTDAEINEQLNKAADGINDGSQYPGMSYEDGIQAFADWLFGDSNEKPFGGMKEKNRCSGIIPDMPTGCAPDNRRPEKICGTCRYFNPEFPVNGKPAPVCLAIKEMKGGTEYTNPRETQHYFHCSNGRYEIGISN